MGTFKSMLRISFSVILLVGLIYFTRDHFEGAVETLLNETNCFLFSFAILAYAAGHFFLTLRFCLSFKILKEQVSLRDGGYLTCLGLFFNFFLPSAVGGDVTKIVVLTRKDRMTKSHAIAGVFQDRLLGVVALLIMGLIAVLIGGWTIISDYGLALGLFLGAFVMGLIFLLKSERFMPLLRPVLKRLPNGWGNQIELFFEQFSELVKAPKESLSAIGLGLVGQLMVVLMYWLIVLSLGFEIKGSFFLMIVPLISLISMLPSLGGLGVREAGLVFFLKSVIPLESALAASILAALIVYSVGLVAGAICLSVWFLDKK